jgi:ABC-type antimicrobial peptide transport system permease subunit
MVCAENGFITIVGCLTGIAGSVLASKTVASLLYGVSPHDPVVLGTTAGMLMCVAAAASLVPAIKAASIDPLSAIRYE